MLVYAATIFLSAFLLFQIQPMIAKFILPWFGGSAAVWSAALLFFQLVLLGGYFYAHCLVRYLQPKRQFWVHSTLLAASLLTLPIVPSAIWKPTGGDDPTLRILLLLVTTIGLPYALLSATSPLLQAWYLRTHKGVVPYRLFALSNFGSMLALLTYPSLVEPQLTLGRQAVIWSVAYGIFALACGFAGWRSSAGFGGLQAESFQEDSAKPPKATTLFLWIGLAACASTLLLATTSHLTQNVAPIPLLWIAPLSLYLLSFILCFESDHFYNRWIFLPLLAVALASFTYGLYMIENNEDIKRLIPMLCIALFVCCMVCHGELARQKPHPRYLTQFYLMVSVGGAVGGLFVALAAPRIFRNYLELPVGMVACAVLVTIVLWNKPASATDPGQPRPLWIRAALVLITIGFTGYLGYNQIKQNRGYILSARNFYGVLRVRDEPASNGIPAYRALIHGTINHGTQLLQPGSDRIATSYFGPGSGVSRGFQAVSSRGPLRVGVIGLGAGVTATMARAGDTLHYYEINPLIREIANTQFGFFRGCPADKDIYMGDGRLILERLPSERLDYLVLDAFSSDAIPMHLLTREAYKIYQKHLKPDGAIAVNVSNRYMNLVPVVAQAMSELGWSGVLVTDEGDDEGGGPGYYSASSWVVIGPSERLFRHPSFRDSFVEPLKLRENFRPWTDDFSNVIQILK